MLHRQRGKCVSGPQHFTPRHSLQGRSSDPEDLVHSPCACGLSRSAHVLEFRFSSRGVRRGSLREYFFPFGFAGKGRDTVSGLSFRSYWNQRSPLVYLLFCDSEDSWRPDHGFVAAAAAAVDAELMIVTSAPSFTPERTSPVSVAPRKVT